MYPPDRRRHEKREVRGSDDRGRHDGHGESDCSSQWNPGLPRYHSTPRTSSSHVCDDSYSRNNPRGISARPQPEGDLRGMLLHEFGRSISRTSGKPYLVDDFEWEADGIQSQTKQRVNKYHEASEQGGERYKTKDEMRTQVDNSRNESNFESQGRGYDDSINWSQEKSMTKQSRRTGNAQNPNNTNKTNKDVEESKLNINQEGQSIISPPKMSSEEEIPFEEQIDFISMVRVTIADSDKRIRELTKDVDHLKSSLDRENQNIQAAGTPGSSVTSNHPSKVLSLIQAQLSKKEEDLANEKKRRERCAEDSRQMKRDFRNTIDSFIQYRATAIAREIENAIYQHIEERVPTGSLHEKTLETQALLDKLQELTREVDKRETHGVMEILPRVTARIDTMEAESVETTNVVKALNEQVSSLSAKLECFKRTLNTIPSHIRNIDQKYDEVIRFVSAKETNSAPSHQSSDVTRENLTSRVSELEMRQEGADVKAIGIAKTIDALETTVQQLKLDAHLPQKDLQASYNKAFNQNATELDVLQKSQKALESEVTRIAGGLGNLNRQQGDLFMSIQGIEDRLVSSSTVGDNTSPTQPRSSAHAAENTSRSKLPGKTSNQRSTGLNASNNSTSSGATRENSVEVVSPPPDHLYRQSSTVVPKRSNISLEMRVAIMEDHVHAVKHWKDTFTMDHYIASIVRAMRQLWPHPDDMTQRLLIVEQQMRMNLQAFDTEFTSLRNLLHEKAGEEQVTELHSKLERFEEAFGDCKEFTNEMSTSMRDMTDVLQIDYMGPRILKYLINSREFIRWNRDTAVANVLPIIDKYDDRIQDMKRNLANVAEELETSMEQHSTSMNERFEKIDRVEERNDLIQDECRDLRRSFRSLVQRLDGSEQKSGSMRDGPILKLTDRSLRDYKVQSTSSEMSLGSSMLKNKKRKHNFDGSEEPGKSA